MFKTIFDFSEYEKELKEYEKDFLEINKVVYNKMKLENEIFFDCSFVSSDEIKEINKNNRNKDYVTDVISFAFWDQGIKTPLLGELFICYEKVVEQAKEYEHSLRREVCFLYLHGLLHLLGYDHIIKEEEEIMFSLQDEILTLLKIER